MKHRYISTLYCFIKEIIQTLVGTIFAPGLHYAYRNSIARMLRDNLYIKNPIKVLGSKWGHVKEVRQ